MSNAEVNEGFFEEEKAEAVAEERARWEKVVAGLVAALEMLRDAHEQDCSEHSGCLCILADVVNNALTNVNKEKP